MEKQTKGQEPSSLADCPEFLALTEKEQKFVVAYTSHWNGNKAAIEAGYAKKSARITASQLLTKPNIKVVIDLCNQVQAKQLEDKYAATKDRIQRELARVAFSNMKTVAKWGPQYVEMLESDGLDEDQAAGLKSISYSTSSSSQGESSSISFSMHDKVKALQILANIKGMLKEPDDANERKPVDPGVKDRLLKLRAKYMGQRK